MKALEKDRTRRYETANGFAADILRHLADEPVVAAPPSRATGCGSSSRKHRGAVIAASLVLLALLAGIVGTWGCGQAIGRGGRRARPMPNSAKSTQRAGRCASRRRSRPSTTRRSRRSRRPRRSTTSSTKDLLTQAEPANNAVEDKVTLLEVLDRAADEGGNAVRGPAGTRSDPRAGRSRVPITAWRPGKRPKRNGGPCSTRRGSADPRSAEAYRRSRRARAHPSTTAVDGTPRSWRWPRQPPRDSKRTLGPDHPDTLTANNLAGATRPPASSAEAIALFEAASATPRTPSSAPTTPTR